MREYKLIFDNTDGKDIVFLIPVGESPVSHAIRFEDKDKAHEYKLALGLGTHPDPQVRPDAYRLLAEEYAGAPMWEVFLERVSPNEEVEPGCCQSGCPGCPWTEEQIRLGKL